MVVRSFIFMILVLQVGAQTCSNLFVTFEGGTNGGTVNANNVSSNAYTFGNLQGYWVVNSNDGGVAGFPGALSFGTNAQHSLYAPISVCGDGTQDGSGSLGLVSYPNTNSFWHNLDFNFSNQVSQVTVEAWLWWNITNVANFDILTIHHTTGTGAFNNFLLSCRPTFAFVQAEIAGCGTCNDFLTNSNSGQFPNKTWYHVKMVFNSTTNTPTMQILINDVSNNYVGGFTCMQACNGTLAGYVALGIHTSSYLTADTNQYVLLDSILISEGTNTVVPCNHPTNEIACDYGALTNAIACAQEGDTILIDPGTSTILDTVTIDRNISFNIKGSGTNSTTLIGTNALGSVFSILSTSTNLFTISGINCVEAGSNNTFFAVGQNNPGTPLIGPVRLYNLSLTNITFWGMSIGSCDSYTLVDHCNFVVIPNPGWNCIVLYGNQWFSWSTNGNQLGTMRNNVIEDCTFKNNSGNVGNGFFDGYNGGAAVFRHCTFDGNAATGVHGYDSTVTSFKSLEVYNNVFTNVDNLMCGCRGGELQYFSNTVYCVNPSSSGQGNAGPGVDYYRAVAGVPAVVAQLGYPGVTITNHYSTNWVDSQYLQIGFPNYTFYTQISSGGHQNVSGAILLGSDLPHSMSNLVSCLNADPTGAGAVYTAISTNAYPVGKSPNNDMLTHTDSTGTNLYLLNRLDGTNVYSGSIAGYPAAMQPGVITMGFRTNNANVVYPCFQWSNTIHYSDSVVTNIVWVNKTAGVALQPNYATNLMVEGRDYINFMVATNYTPLQYPHPLTGITNAVAIGNISGKFTLSGSGTLKTQ